MLRLPTSLALALLGAAFLPATAGAAFAPKLAIALDPATPDQPTALTSTITQASGETPIRRVVLQLPQRFGPAFGSQLQPCTDEQKSARACPEPSKMGDARAETQFGTFTGTVNYGTPSAEGPRLFVFLSNGVSFLDQTLEGKIIVTPEGFQTIFDGLPNVETSSFRLALAGAPRSLIKTPRDCGDYVFKAQLTSQKDEPAAAEAPVTVGPCPYVAPKVLDVELARRGRAVRFRLLKAMQVEVLVKRGKKVLSRSATAAAKGENVVAIKRPKRAGRYRVVVRATDERGATGVGHARLVRKAKRRR